MQGVRDEQILQHVPSLRRYGWALARDEQAMADLVQDTLERAFEHRHRFEPGTNLRSWLFTIMHNLFIDDRRRAARRAGAQRVMDDEQPLAVAAPATPVELLDFKQAFDRLSPAHQEVVVLVGVEGLTYEEVAEVTQVSVGTVKSRLFRARESLRTQLHGGEPAVGSTQARDETTAVDQP